MLNNFLITVLGFFTNIDNRFELNITDLLKQYGFPSRNSVFTLTNMVLFVKVSAYSLILLLPFSFLRIVKREDRTVFLLFAIVLIVLVVSTFAVFFGFLRLAFI